MKRALVAAVVILSMLVPHGLAAGQDTSQLTPPLIVRLSDQCVVPPDIARGGLPEAGILAAVAATLLPKVVGGIYNWATGLITKAAERRQVTRDANSGGYFYRVRAQADIAEMRSCIQMLTVGPPGTTWDSLVDAPKIGQAIGQGLKLSDYPGPDVFLELVIDESADRQFFRLIPTHLKMSRAFSGSRRETALVAAVTFGVPGSKDPFGSDAFKISGVRPRPQPFAYKDLVGLDGKWNAKPEYSEALHGRLAKDKNRELSAQSFNPVNISVAITETQEANVLMQSVATALTGGQEGVVNAVGAALPTEANQETAAVAEADAKNAYAEAVATALAAIEEAKAAELALMQARADFENAQAGEIKDKAQVATATAEAAFKAKQAAAVKAKGAANKAAAKLRIGQPYPEIYKMG